MGNQNSSKKFNEHNNGNMQRNYLNSIEVEKNYNYPKYSPLVVFLFASFSLPSYEI